MSEYRKPTILDVVKYESMSDLWSSHRAPRLLYGGVCMVSACSVGREQWPVVWTLE